MIEGIGVDVIHDNQVPDQVLQPGDPFFEHTFTKEEAALARRRSDAASFLKGRFAGKEAVFKALGAHPDDLKRWDCIEILSDENGKPTVSLHESMADYARSRRIERVLVSLSRDEGCYVAFSVALAAENARECI